MTKTEVKRKLKEKNLTYRDLARKWRVTTAMVSLFINREAKSARLERRLAEELRVTVEELRGDKAA